MSQLYGTLTSDSGVSTRAGHRYVRASAQSWEGSVTVELHENMVSIDVQPGSGTGGRRLLTVTLDKLLQAEGLVMKKEKGKSKVRKEG